MPVLVFILGGIGFTCEELQQGAAGCILCGSIFIAFAYPLMWSLESDLIDAKDRIEECSAYDQLYLLTTIGTIFGVAFFLIYYAVFCCAPCEFWPEFDDYISGKKQNKHNKIKHIQLQELSV